MKAVLVDAIVHFDQRWQGYQVPSKVVLVQSERWGFALVTGVKTLGIGSKVGEKYWVVSEGYWREVFVKSQWNYLRQGVKLCCDDP